MLTIDDLVVVRGGRRVIDRLSLNLRRGEIRLLVGASGTGKTTLLRTIAGLELPEAGRIEIDGKTASSAHTLHLAPHRRNVAMAFQDGALWSHMTVEQHLRFGLSTKVASLSERETRVDNVLKMLGLSEMRHRKPGPMSGGERQRIGLARALVARRGLLLLDEPMAHIDLLAQKGLAERLTSYLREEGITTLWVTHRPGEVRLAHSTMSYLDRNQQLMTIPEEKVEAWLHETGL